MNSSPTQFVDIANARVDEQRQVMEKIMAEGHCPFCPENFQLYHQRSIIKDGKYWFVTQNQWPYNNTKIQLLAIAKTHIETLHEITPEAGAELFQLLGEIEVEEQIPGGGLALRFGDTDYSAGTVKHLHAQLIVPDIEKHDFLPVRFKIGKDKEKRL